MEKKKLNSLIKFKEIMHGVNFSVDFIYPCVKYFRKLKSNANNNYTLDYLKSFDTYNIRAFFEYMKYNEKLKEYLDNYQILNSDINKKKYDKLKSFYMIISDFTLKIICELYYKYLYDFNNNNAHPINWYIGCEDIPLNNTSRNSKGVDFTF